MAVAGGVRASIEGKRVYRLATFAVQVPSKFQNILEFTEKPRV